MKKNAVLYLTRGAMIASLYVVLTYISSIFGLSSGVIQFRISEALCVLPVFFSEATLGLAIGCFFSNLAFSGAIWDAVFGSLATLIGAFGARILKFLPKKMKWLLGAPTVISNAIIVPFILKYAYGADGAYLYFFLTVGIGELVCALFGGAAVYYSLSRKLRL